MTRSRMRRGKGYAVRGHLHSGRGHAAFFERPFSPFGRVRETAALSPYFMALSRVCAYASV